jgi:hypothetical protein
LQPVDKLIALRQQPQVPRVQVALIHRPIALTSHFVWLLCGSSPEIGNKPVQVVDGLNAGSVRSCEQGCQAARERLDVVAAVAEALPDQIGCS